MSGAATELANALERIADALEKLVALEERKFGAGTRVLEIAARQEREMMEGRPVVELVNPKNRPGPA